MYFQRSDTLELYGIIFCIETSKNHFFCWKNCDLYVLYMISFCELNWSFNTEDCFSILCKTQLLFWLSTSGKRYSFSVPHKNLKHITQTFEQKKTNRTKSFTSGILPAQESPVTSTFFPETAGNHQPFSKNAGIRRSFSTKRQYTQLFF